MKNKQESYPVQRLAVIGIRKKRLKLPDVRSETSYTSELLGNSDDKDI